MQVRLQYINNKMQRQYSKDLNERMQKDRPFYEKMKHISQKFRQIQQLAIYSSLEQSAKSMILSIKNKTDKQCWESYTNNHHNIQIIYASKLPRGQNCIQKILMNISVSIPRPSQPFSIIFINTLGDHQAYSDFKKSLQFLPFEYYSQLENLYILHASFKAKAYDLVVFDYLGTFIKNKTAYFNSFESLAETIGISIEIFNKMPKEIVNELSKRETSAKIYINSLEQASNKLKMTKYYSVQQSIKKENIKMNKNFQEYELGHTGAPLIFQLLLYFFDRNEEYRKVQGLFRKSANIQQQSELLDELDKENYQCLQRMTDPHLIANAIKKFFTNLKQPLVPYNYFESLVNAQPQQWKSIIIKMVSQMQNNRKMTLLLFIQLFRDKIFPLEMYNQMNAGNTSIVIAPCLMRAQVQSIKQLFYAPKLVQITKIFFKDFTEIFGEKSERIKLKRHNVLSQQEEIFKTRLGSLMGTFKSEKELNFEQNLTEEQLQGLGQADQFLNAFHNK